MRITEGMLNCKVHYLNIITTGTKFVLDKNIAGWSLERYSSPDSFGTSTIFERTTIKDLFNQVSALIKGITGNY